MVMRLAPILIIEGRKEDLRKKYGKKFSADPEHIEVLDYALGHPFLAQTNFKYGDFLLKNLHPNSSIEEIIDDVELIKEFDRFQQSLEEKDINKYSFAGLRNAIQSHKETSKSQQNKFDSSGAKKLYEDSNILIVKPLTYEASCKYGSGTRWCTTMANQPSYFKQYTTTVKVVDQNKQALSDVRLNIYKHNGTVQKLNTGMNGAYSWKNEGAERVDSIVANLINHEDASIAIPATISGNCVDTVNYMVTLLDKQDSEYIRLDLVLYNFDKYFLRPEGKVELDKLVKYMKSHPDLKVELSSHTDSRGSDKYNLKLSKQRAQSCVDYIVAQGISRKLITAKGYGETKLLNKCKNGVYCSVDDHQMNRRTELKLITPEEVELDNNKLGN